MSMYRALSNPLVSMEAKEHARTMLTDLDEEGARQELYREKPKSPTRVAGGLRGYVLCTMLHDLILLVPGCIRDGG